MKKIDLVTLSKADLEKGKIDFSSREVVIDPATIGRLVKEGIAKNTGELTEKGCEVCTALVEKVKVLKAGVPFSPRKAEAGEKLPESLSSWTSGAIGKVNVMVNDDMFFVEGLKRKREERVTGHVVERDIPRMMAVVLSGDFVPVRPHTYQIESLGGIELVWMADKEQSLFVPLQAKYFDLTIEKFAKADFFARKDGMLVQARVLGKGLKDDVVAAIMSIDLAELIEQPKRREGWWENEEM